MKRETKRKLSTLWDIATGEQELGDVVKAYLKETYEVYSSPLDSLDDELRFQHLLNLGGSGCGKSTFFRMLLKNDIKRAKKGQCTVIHIDPVNANDEIIMHAGVERYSNAILIDVSDMDSLPCLDIFETSSVRDPRLRTANLIGVFTAVCAGLVDQALTTQMKTLFSYCAQVAVRSDYMGLRELLVLLSNPLRYLDIIGVDPDSNLYAFFRDEVDGNGSKGRLPMRETASSLRSRIHAVLGDPIIERIFCSGKPTMNLIKEINKGSMIFVSTRKGHLTSDGARMLGNYILTLTHRAMQERVDMPVHLMKPTFLYYDEVQNAMTAGHNEILCEMLDEDRKYKLSVNIATTRFGQFASAMGDAALSCTETKLCGKMSSRGAGQIAVELFGNAREGIEKIAELGNYRFYCRIKSLHDSAVMVVSDKHATRKLGRKNRKALELFRKRMTFKYGQGAMERRDLNEDIEQVAQEVVNNKINSKPLADIGAL
jgi:hypothetical protein